MSVLLWIVVAWLAWGAVATVLSVGDERKPITPRFAALVLVLVAVQIVLLIVGGHS